jgi:tetratricopeptide (TPR) repeat protein
MRHYVLLFLLIASPCFAKELTLPPELLQPLAQMNSGHLIEAYSELKTYTAENPDDRVGIFLKAFVKWKMMWLSTYSDSDKNELQELFELIEKKTTPDIKEDNEALFFYTGVLGMRAQLAATENEWWETAQLGKQMKRQAEVLVEQDPDLNDAYYFLGSFDYFADALPSYIKFLRSFMFLPGGDRKEGSKQLVRAYENGKLVSAEAGRTLAIIYTYYEKIPKYGIQMCDNLLAQHPDSFDVRLYKGINLYYSSRFEDSESWFKELRSKILSYSQSNGGTEDKVVSVYMPMEREVRYWTARSLIQQEKYDQAKEILEKLIDPQIYQPWWIMRAAYLSLAQIYYIQDEPTRAEELVNKVLKWDDAKESHEKAKLLLKKKGKIDKFDIDFY